MSTYNGLYIAVLFTGLFIQIATFNTDINSFLLFYISLYWSGVVIQSFRHKDLPLDKIVLVVITIIGLGGLFEIATFVAKQELVFMDQENVFIQSFEWLPFPVLRMSGWYFDPNFLGVILIGGVSIASLLYRHKTKWLLALLGLFTFSRGYFLSLLLLIISGMGKLWRTSLLVLATIGAMFFTNSGVSTDKSLEQRFEHIKESVSFIRANPFFGGGIGYSLDTGDSHNTILQLLIYQGLVGTVIFVLYVTALFYVMKLKFTWRIFVPLFPMLFVNFALIKYFFILLFLSFFSAKKNTTFN